MFENHGKKALVQNETLWNHNYKC